MTKSPQEYRELVRGYGQNLLPRFELYAQVLTQVLEYARDAIVPHALVQARAKSVASFAEKIIRPGKNYTDPLKDMTDLCGARVITHTSAEVKAIGQFLTKHFEIDKENTRDAADALQADQFGYRSVHYIVSFIDGKFPTKTIPVKVPLSVLGLKAEVQVRTITEHCWADIGHDRIYKGLGAAPQKWQRVSARTAANLESANEEFSRLADGVGAYSAIYGRYMTPEMMRQRLQHFQAVLEDYPNDSEFAHQAARLAICLEDWPEVERILQPWQASNNVPLLICLGFARCQRYQQNSQGKSYRKGQAYLSKAVRVALGGGEAITSPADEWLQVDEKELCGKASVEAICTLADSWIGVNEKKVFHCYRKACQIDQANSTGSRANNSRAVIGYAVAKMIDRRIPALDPLDRHVLEPALRSCQEQAEIEVDLPWAYYRIGECNLLLNRVVDSLIAYAKAVQMSGSEFMISSALATLDRLAAAELSLPGQEPARRLLLLGKAIKFGGTKTKDCLKQLVAPEAKENQEEKNFCIVAGGYDRAEWRDLAGYLPLLRGIFASFQGTFVAGGTDVGTGSLVAKLVEGNNGFQPLGYVSSYSSTAHNIISTFRRRTVEDTGFGPLQPLQNWIDLVSCGIKPTNVTLLGVKGGALAQFEYRLALALGATVNVLRKGGGDVEKRLFEDPDWNSSDNLHELPPSS